MCSESWREWTGDNSGKIPIAQDLHLLAAKAAGGFRCSAEVK